MINKLKASLEHAKSLFEQRNYEACKKELQDILNSNYEVATCYYYLGLIRLNLKDYDDAAKMFSTALKSDPGNFSCLYYLGVIAEADKNNDLALRYYSKTVKERPSHPNAIKAIKRLDGQNINLDEQNINFDSNSVHVHPPAHDDNNQDISDRPKMPNSPPKKGLQIYDNLLLAEDEESKIAVEMISATRMIKRRLRISAFIGSFFLRVIIVPPILTFLYYRLGLPFSSAAMYMGGPENTILSVYIITTLLFLIYTVIKIKSTVVTIDRGFIQIKKGVFSNRYPLTPIYKLHHFETYQGFFNLMTGDCTLILGLEILGSKSITIRLKGLGKINEMNELKENLQSLRIQLRNTPVIRSGIYG